MEIAVIGGGHGCYAAAAHLTEQGHGVRLWRRDGAALAPVRETGAITLIDHEGTRDVSLALATDDLGEAMAGAELVVIPLPCTAHEDLSKAMAPHFADGQVVYLPPGTFGSYIFARAMREAGNGAGVAFAETGTLPYLARKQGPAHVRISVYATRLPTGVFPARETGRALERAGPGLSGGGAAGRAGRRADECRSGHPSAADRHECGSAGAFRGLGYPQRGHPAVDPPGHRRPRRGADRSCARRSATAPLIFPSPTITTTAGKSGCTAIHPTSA